uniref:SRR1-like domain-containing protein n=1 Tax=Panagrolaimus davidi TaxID=227884 RepID=A0A914PML1_9BILA
MESDGFKLHVNKKKRKNFIKPLTKSCERDPVSMEDVRTAMKWAELNSSEASSLLYSHISSMLKNKTVIQIQIYGIGKLDSKHSNGPLQLSVAFELFKQFKEIFPQISITCQDPILVEEEMKYLKSKEVQIFEDTTFSSEHFIQASTSANISNSPALVCYMIHGDWEMFDEFLKAHWNSKLLSQIIFVGNELGSLESHPKYSTIHQRIKEFSKLCESKSLNFDKGCIASSAFYLTNVFIISEKNAEILINLF